MCTHAQVASPKYRVFIEYAQLTVKKPDTPDAVLEVTDTKTSKPSLQEELSRRKGSGFRTLPCACDCLLSCELSKNLGQCVRV